MKILRADSNMVYEDFYREYHQSIFKYFVYKCSNREIAEDLTSQVFLYCYQNFDSYDPQKASLSSWVYMIAGSRFKNYCRDRKVFADIDEVGQYIPDENQSLDGAMMLDDMRKQIAKTLMKLPQRQRLIVILRYFKNMSAVDIAKKLDMSPVNVRVQLSRALDKMEIELEDLR